jgi:hypothetical protein
VNSVAEEYAQNNSEQTTSLPFTDQPEREPALTDAAGKLA